MPGTAQTGPDQAPIRARPNLGQPGLAPVEPCVSFPIWVSRSEPGQDHIEIFAQEIDEINFTN